VARLASPTLDEANLAIGGATRASSVARRASPVVERGSPSHRQGSTSPVAQLLARLAKPASPVVGLASSEFTGPRPSLASLRRLAAGGSGRWQTATGMTKGKSEGFTLSIPFLILGQRINFFFYSQILSKIVLGHKNFTKRDPRPKLILGTNNQNLALFGMLPNRPLVSSQG